MNLFYGDTIAAFAGNADTIYEPGDVTEVADPLGGGKTVIRMIVPDSHTAGVTENPRAQLSTPDIITSGIEYWTATEVLIPSSVGTITDWWTVHVPAWGPPFGGTGAPVHAEASWDRLINWERTSLYNFDGPIEGPSPWPRDTWVQILYHMKFAEAGFVELWLNGKQVTFFEPGHSYNPKSRPQTTKLEMQTMEKGTNDGGANHSGISVYRKKGMLPTATCYFKGLSVATTKEDLLLSTLEGGEATAKPSALIVPSRRAVRGLTLR